MAKKNNKQVKETKKFKNPAKQLWGKIIITTLAILMACGSLISLIYLIVQSATRV